LRRARGLRVGHKRAAPPVHSQGRHGPLANRCAGLPANGSGPVATDMHPDHPRAKGLEQLLTIAGVVTQIGDDQTIPVIAGIDLRQRTGAHTAIKVLRQLVEFRNAKDSRHKATKAADHRGRAIAAAADVVGDSAAGEDEAKGLRRETAVAPCKSGCMDCRTRHSTTRPEAIRRLIKVALSNRSKR
jgi:hypothetical protein